MRFTLTALVWLLLVGGLALYIQQRDRNAPPPIQTPASEAAPPQEYTLEITPTFAPEADAFALQGDPAAGATLLARLGEHELYRSQRTLPAGETLRLHPVSGLVVGHNELYLWASPPAAEAGQDHALRVRLLQGSRVIFDQTLWGESGANVAGAIPFTLAATVEAAHEH